MSTSVLYVSDAALAVMTEPHPRMTEAKDPQIPFMTFERSACGRYLFYFDAKFVVLVVLPRADFPGCIIVAFYQRMLSNFASVEGARCLINGKEVDFSITEQFFKAACVLMHMQEEEGGSTNEEILDALKTVMSAPTPVVCKNATRKIPVFDGAAWDRVSYGVMCSAQDWKCMDSKYHDLMQNIGSLAKTHGIPMQSVCFLEAAGNNDMRWGCGLSAKQVSDAVEVNIGDPKWLSEFVFNQEYPGMNHLGLALDATFLKVVGSDGCFIGRSVEDYREAVGYSFPCFTYAGDKHKRASEVDTEDGGDAKRTRSLSD